MKKTKRFIVYVMLFAELMWILQPYSVLAKNNIDEKYNKKGNAEVVELTEAELASLGDVEQEYQIILPDDNKRSVFLSDYLDEKNKDEKKVKITETTDTNKKEKKSEDVITVDNGIEISDPGAEKKEYTNKSNTFSGYLPETLDYSNPIRLDYGKTKVTYIPMFYTFHNALTSNNQVTYYTDRRNTVFNYYFTNDSFKEEIVLMGPQDSYRFDYKIEVEKGSLLEEEGHIFILDNSKKKLFELKAPVVMDAIGNKITDLELTMTEVDGFYNVGLVADSEWMNAPERIFPVIIDPEFNLIASDTDTYISETSNTVNYENETELKIGNDGGINRGLFKANTDVYNTVHTEGTSINEAYIKLFTPGYIPPVVQNMQVCAFDSAVDYTTVTWDSGNNVSSTCFPVTTTTETELIYHTDLFSPMTQQEASVISVYNIVADPVVPEDPEATPVATIGMNADNINLLFDGDINTGVFSENGDNLVDQEIVIDLNEFIRPEEVMINFGGKADSSNEDLYIEFYNKTSEESLVQLVSNGMSAINEDGEYEVTMAFEPSTTLYDQVKLKTHSNTINGNPEINEFQITKYQTEDNYVVVPLDTYFTSVINDSTMFNHGFYLRMNDETSTAITVNSNNNAEHQPVIYVDYESDIDVLETYPLDDIKLFVNPVVTYSGSTASFDTVNFTGVATPINSEVSLYLKKSEIDEYVLNGVIIDGITTDYIAGTEANFSSVGNIGQIAYDFNELYQIEAEVTKNQVTSNRVSDTFMITKLQYYNSVADLAFFYGIDANTLRTDNNISGDLDVNSVVFIRNPKRNIGIPYTSASMDYITEMKDNDYLLGLNSFNEYYQDKVNVNTGNYYLSHTDMTYMMFGEEVEIKRVYNSMNSLGVQGFGESWDYNFNFRLINYDDNKLVFKKEDGQKIYFEKDGSNYVTQNNDYHSLSYLNNEYVIESKDRTYTFNDNGQILKLTFNSGHEINYQYNNDRLTTVVLQNGDELKLSYDNTGLITSLEYVSVNADKKTTAAQVDYSYINDRLSEVSDPLGFTVNYQYDDSGRITSWIDEDNKTVDTVVYDDENRVTSITDGKGIVNTFSYYKNKGYTDWTQDSELIKRVRYNSSFKTELIEYENGSEKKKTYRSDNGQLDVETLMNGTTLTYAYDSNQNITTITRSDGKTKTFTYDSDNNMLSEKDYNGNVTHYEYTNNLLTKTTFANTGTVINTYNAEKLLESTTDANNNTTSYLYDSKGRLVKVIYPNAETSEYMYNLMGYVSRETDTNGNNRIISRNYRNEVIYETSFEGDITQTFYNGIGNVLTAVDGNNHTTNYTYNSNSELIRKTEPNGSYSTYEYDSYGNLTTSTQYDSADSLVKSDAVNTYDQYQRLIKVVYPDGSYEEYQYNIEGELERKITSTTSSEELVTLYRYDRFVNEVIQEHLPDGNIITRNYDANGNMTSEIDITGSRTRYDYNSMNLLSKETHDYGLVIDYTYDKNGNLLEKKETDNQTNTYYSSWSDWLLLSDTEYDLTSDYQTKTQYRSKDYETVWVNDYSYNEYMPTYNRRVNTDTWNWMHTTNLGLDWAEGYLGEAPDTSGHPVDVYGYKDYEYTSYCEAHLTSDDGGTYCPKFKNHTVEYEFGGYPVNFSNWQNEKIIQNENNIVETQILYSKDDSNWSTSLNISDEDTDLIDKEYILKRKFYSTTGLSEWSDTEPPSGDGVVIEEQYLYREKKLNESTIRSALVLIEGYTKDPDSRIIESATAGYLHTNTLGLPWAVGSLGEKTYNNKTIQVYGYRDYDYELWGACSAPVIDTNGDKYCKKAYYTNVTYEHNGAGEYGAYQEDLIFDDETNEVDTKTQYRSETRSYSDYQLLSDDSHPEESDIIKDEAYVRVRSQMIVPDDVNLLLNEAFDIMNGVSATDSLGNDISSQITTNISSIDTSVAGTYDIEYKLTGTDLMVIRHVEVYDGQQATMKSQWTPTELLDTQLTVNDDVELLESDNYSQYMESSTGWVNLLETNPGTTPASGNDRIVIQNPYYRTRTMSSVVLEGDTPPSSYYRLESHAYTKYTETSRTTLDWDSLDRIDVVYARGGNDNEPIDYKESNTSGYWGVDYHGDDYYAYYDHWRDGKHFIYKYGTKYSGYTEVFKVDRVTESFTEYYNYTKFSNWSDWIATSYNNNPDTDTIQYRDLYSYIDGNLLDYMLTEVNPPTNYYEIDSKIMYKYQVRNTFSYNKFDYLVINETKDLSTYYSYNNPLTGDVSSLVSIQVELNGTDLTSEMNGTSFTFDETGLYEITYTTTDGLEGKQTIDVRTVNNEHTTTYTYNNMNQLASETDAEGNTVTYAYTNNNLTTKMDEAGNTENFIYNRNNQLTETNVKNSAGTVVSEMNYEYDGVGNKLSETDLYNNKTEYVYDINNQLRQVRQPVSNNGLLSTATTQYEYDAAGRMVKQTNPAGLITTTSYDNMSQITSIKTKAPDETEVTEKVFIYDVNGNVTSLTENGLVTTFTYDVYGKKIKEVKPNGLNIYYFYDSFNRLISKTESAKTDKNTLDSTDRNVEYSYNSRNNLISETDVLGRTASYQYDVFNNLTTSKDFSGLFVKTYYNRNNLPVMQIDQRGNSSYKNYNNLNQVVTEVAANGAVSGYEYDALGNVIKVTNALNETTEFTYNMYGSVLVTTDALGNKIINTYTPDNKAATTTYKDSINSILKMEEYKYDILGNNISQSTTYTNPLTDTLETVTIQNGYNAYGQLIQSIDGRNHETTFTYDNSHQLINTNYPNGLIKENVYNNFTGELVIVKTIDPDLLTGSERTVAYDYNVFGQVSKITADNGAFTTKVYSDEGLLISESFSNDDLTATTDDYIKTYTYDVNGQLTSIVDNADYDKATDTYSNQTLETRAYNEYGDVVSLTNQSGLITTYSYDRYGNQISEVKKNVVTEEVINNTLFTTTEDLVTNISYDLLNRPVKTIVPNGLETTIVYNEINQVTSKSTTANSVTNTESYTLDMLANVLTTTNSENETTTNVYDGLGRLVKTTLPNGEYTETVYDDNGNAIKVTKNNSDSSKSIKQEFVYDEVNNLTQTKEYRTVNSIENVFLTTNTYNKFNDLISVQDQTGNTVSYVYDDMGNKTQTIYSNGSTIDYTYTKSNKLATKTYDNSEGSALGLFTVTEEYEYYIDGKLQRKSDNPSTSAANDKKTEYYYYDDGQLVEHSIELSSVVNSVKVVSAKQTVNYTYNNMGQIILMKDAEGSTVYHYTDSNQLSSTERVHEDVVYDVNFIETTRTETSRDTLLYEYDEYGNQTKIIYDDNSTVDYTYDSIGRMSSVTDSNGTTTYTYDLTNNQVTEQLPTNKKTVKTYEFDQVTHLVTTEHDYQLDTDITVFEQYLTYDESGNVLTETRNNNGSTTTITNTYNERSELTESIQVNGTDKTVYTYNISPLANKSEVIEHYENDVLISTETKSYTYNYMNQLVEATIDGEHIDYFYDAYGNLIQENNTTSNANTYYTYDLKNQLVTFIDDTETLEFEYDGSGNRTSKSITTGTSTETVSYINDITKANEEVISLTYNSTETNYTYGLDRLYEGNEEYLHDSYGNVVEHASETYEYTPYGELISGIIDGVNEYGYKGEVHDTDTLQYLRARYYHTSLMQFISEDTYTGKDTNPLSQNRYTFVKNNPFKYSDPSGHWPNWNKFKEDTSNFFKKNGQAISGALNVAAGFGQMFVGATLVGTGVGAAIGATMFAYGASNALEGAQDIYHGVRHDGKTSVNIIRSGFETVGKAVGGEKGKKIATGVYYASEFALDTLSGKAAFSAVNKVAKTSKASKATTVLGKIGASLDDTADIIKITTKSHVDNILKAGANGLSKLKSAATDIPGTFNKIKDTSVDLFHAGRNKWDNGIEFISRQKDNLVNSYKNVKSGIGNKFNTVKETISAADEKLSAKIYDYMNNLGGNHYAYADGPYAGSVPSSSRTKGMFSETIDTVGDTTKSVKESKNVANLTQSKIKEILSLDKGLRPNPSTYLSEDYITNHLSLFDEGVTKFSWTKPTRPVGPPGGTFVMPKSVADDLIIEAGGDVKKLEELLGLNLGDLGDAPVRIDIADPIGLRMPDGNELGANNFWVPGGYTSGGIPEATIDQTSLSDIVVNEIFK